MPTLAIGDDLAMHYLVDDYTDPWTAPETVLLLHGNAESSAAWYAWVPHLARTLRVVRPDMRGYGGSTPMPRDFPWSLDTFIDDFVRLMDSLGVERFHLVGAKIAGTIARRFAARFPDRVRTLTVVGTPGPVYDTSATAEAVVAEVEAKGMEHWARRTMGWRLGSDFPPEAVEWWIQLMARSPKSTQICLARNVFKADITRDLPLIRCPTLVIATAARPLDETRAWQSLIPRSELLVLPGDSIHVAATDADRCATETLAFIRRSRPAGG